MTPFVVLETLLVNIPIRKNLKRTYSLVQGFVSRLILRKGFLKKWLSPWITRNMCISCITNNYPSNARSTMNTGTLPGIVRKWTHPQLSLRKRINGKRYLEKKFSQKKFHGGNMLLSSSMGPSNADLKSPSKVIENPRKIMPYATHNEFESLSQLVDSKVDVIPSPRSIKVSIKDPPSFQ
jgi:hypothetical protein